MLPGLWFHGFFLIPTGTLPWLLFPPFLAPMVPGLGIGLSPLIGDFCFMSVGLGVLAVPNFLSLPPAELLLLLTMLL